MDKEEIFKKLNENPIFQLSLSSKELFHSNFLYWLGNDATLKDFFVEIIKKMYDVDLSGIDYLVLREFKHFDFCICEKDKSKKDNIGKIILLLENKFKSIPYQKQLHEYLQNSKGFNKNSEPEKLVLLTLITNNSIDNKWKTITYQEYAQILIQNVKGKTDFKSQIILNYADFIKTFSEYINSLLKSDKPIADLSNECLIKLRMDDVWQKLYFCNVSNIFKDKIEGKVKDGTLQELIIEHVGTSSFEEQIKDKTLVIRTGMTRGQGLCEWDYKLTEDITRVLQIQGTAKRRGYRVFGQKGKENALTFVNNELKESSMFKEEHPDNIGQFENQSKSIFIYLKGDKIEESKKASEIADIMVEEILETIKD